MRRRRSPARAAATSYFPEGYTFAIVRDPAGRSLAVSRGPGGRELFVDLGAIGGVLGAKAAHLRLAAMAWIDSRRPAAEEGR